MTQSSNIWTLHVGPSEGEDQSHAWRLAHVEQEQVIWVDLPDEGDVRSLASAVIEAIDPAKDCLVLAVASAWCYGVAVDNPPMRRGWHELIRNDLEEYLPLAAEEMVVDFIRGRDRSYVVAARLTCLQAVLGSLAEAALAAGYAQGVSIAGVCPSVFLAMNEKEGFAEGLMAGVDILLVAHGTQVDVFRLEEGHVVAWHWVGADSQRIIERLEVKTDLEKSASPSAPLRLAAWGLDPAVTAPIVSALGGELVMDEAQTHSTDDLATWAAHHRDRVRPLINLLRPPLGSEASRWKRTPAVSIVMMAAVIFLVGINGAWLWRAYQYDRQVQGLGQEQVALFQRLHPHARRTPGDILGRIQSDHRSLLGRGGAALGGQTPARSLSALDLWVEVFNSLPNASVDPQGVRYQLTRLTLTRESLRLEGLVRSYQEAGQLSEALGHSGQLLVEPPRTTVEHGGQVRFQITGKPVRRSASASVQETHP